jgi:hypothetical protein
MKIICNEEEKRILIKNCIWNNVNSAFFKKYVVITTLFDFMQIG